MGLISILSTNSAVKRKNIGGDGLFECGMLGGKQECFLCAMQPPPDGKDGLLYKVKKFLEKTATGLTFDQCCNLQADGAPLYT